ncbi:MAG: peptidoglycan DD-metalloendopeptidase family protein [Proteobacteria bacterium]|nr:peptidoglycan DD-metalloendopeptidase family protein [Pseudomonadota bacterium]MBU1594646.1 peptidoglycan DD-metalloendopeptidase family protein [Pseudomonadota bacterium]
MSRTLRLGAALTLLLCLAPVALAQPAQLEKVLQREHQKAAEHKGVVQKLAAREKALSSRLTEIEARMKAAEARINEQEAALDVIRAEEAQFAKLYDAVRAKREQAVRELRRLLDLLWPINAQGMHEGARSADSWENADRRFQWTGAVYAKARAALEGVRRQEQELAGVLARQQELEVQVDKQLALINADKDALLRDRLAVNSRINQVNTQRRDLEGELQSILKTIQQLNYQLSSQRSRNFGSNKAALPWPVAGRVVTSFNPEGRPARRGLGIATSEGATVRSVFWGKVVHSDVLRGLGKVVIILHGNDYYSLYAYLSDVSVQPGQDIEKDEPIGHAGYYPEAHGNGVYFELRLHQKPINPQLWLMPAQ